MKDVFYLDTNKVDEMYAKIIGPCALEIEEAKGSISEWEATLIGRIRLAVLAFLGQADASASATFKQQQSTTQIATYSIEPYDKFLRLQKTFEAVGQPTVFSSYAEASRYAMQQQIPVLCNSMAHFNALQYDAANEKLTIGPADSLLLQCGDNYTHADDYYKSIGVHGEMSCSMNNMTRGAKIINQTTHEGILIRGYKGRNIPLGFLGLIRPMPDSVSIKPIAVWV